MIKNLEQLQKIYNTTCNAYEWKINMLEKEIINLKNKIKQTSCTDQKKTYYTTQTKEENKESILIHAIDVVLI